MCFQLSKCNEPWQRESAAVKCVCDEEGTSALPFHFPISLFVVIIEAGSGIFHILISDNENDDG